MSLTDALDRYFAAWNDHDPDAVVRSLADGGSYEDPTTGGPLTGDALAANVATLLAGFPDLHFDLVSVAPTSDTTAAAQWLMQGTNTGPMPAGPATGQTVALPGGARRRPSPLTAWRVPGRSAAGSCRCLMANPGSAAGLWLLAAAVPAQDRPGRHVPPCPGVHQGP